MNVRYKVWLEIDSNKAFGVGPMVLLDGVVTTGSLKKAAESLNMSYNKAWHLVKDLEKVNGFKILERQAGGTGGGNSTLTPEAMALMHKYKAFYDRVSREIEEAYDAFF